MTKLSWMNIFWTMVASNISAMAITVNCVSSFNNSSLMMNPCLFLMMIYILHITWSHKKTSLLLLILAVHFLVGGISALVKWRTLRSHYIAMYVHMYVCIKMSMCYGHCIAEYPGVYQAGRQNVCIIRKLCWIKEWYTVYSKHLNFHHFAILYSIMELFPQIMALLIGYISLRYKNTITEVFPWITIFYSKFSRRQYSCIWYLCMYIATTLFTYTYIRWSYSLSTFTSM